MANLTINFEKEINVSLQPGDTVLFLKNDNLTELGPCVSVADNRLSFVVDVGNGPRPSIGDYFMFIKDNVINSSGVLGYHGEVTITNNSTSFAELYAVNSEINISSN